ncbi:hypothetical protein H4582DRAFT_2113167 [Lactarius indigo]|nr:hypothetical protein H4582DRAFT_2113167 [Lactarius indigo]
MRSTLYKRRAKLEQTLFDLRGEIGAGPYVPSCVRVLFLCATHAQNWTDLRQAALDRLKSENAPRLQRLPCSKTRSPTRGAAGAAREIDSGLRETAELKQRNKRILHLRQVFASKTAEFREALSAILDVKLAFYDNGQVRGTTPVPHSYSSLLRNMDSEHSVLLGSVTFQCYDKWKREQQ